MTHRMTLLATLCVLLASVASDADSQFMPPNVKDSLDRWSASAAFAASETRSMRVSEMIGWGNSGNCAASFCGTPATLILPHARLVYRPLLNLDSLPLE